MPRKRLRDFYVDANGCPTEVVVIGGQTVVIHYDDIPEPDITTVRGLRCTAPVRTVIDMASRAGAHALKRVLASW